MTCPRCRENLDHVIDSRTNALGTRVRRRRICGSCGCRWTTHELAEETLRPLQRLQGFLKKLGPTTSCV